MKNYNWRVMHEEKMKCVKMLFSNFKIAYTIGNIGNVRFDFGNHIILYFHICRQLIILI